MPLSKDRIEYLINAYVSNLANAAEEQEFLDWVYQTNDDSELKAYMLDVWKKFDSTQDFSYVKWAEIYNRATQSSVNYNFQDKKWKWSKLTAAAVVLIMLVSGIYFISASKTQIPVANIQVENNQQEINPPPDSKATLTLDNGRKIEIDSKMTGTIALQGNIRILKLPTGEISYDGINAGRVTYNTLSVPRGSKPFQLMLSDGSKIWLNVESSITYPTKFSGEEREVRITGEVYLEVSHNQLPFKVQKGDLTVKVLGTHFNMNTYEDENMERITLQEGSVMIEKKGISKLLKPGQQAQVKNNGNSSLRQLDNEEMDGIVAWRDGKFKFGINTDIYSIMHQISRWYNVEVEYQGKVSQRFWGSISKDVNLSQVLRILEATGGVKFKVNGSKILVIAVAPPKGQF